MSPKSVCLAAAALLCLAAPATALADPYWEHDGWRGHEGPGPEWRGHEWREHGWRDHDGWRGRPVPTAWYGPRCVVEDRGFYDWYGRYVPQPVRVCYR
jgi:hypothetical protein